MASRKKKKANAHTLQCQWNYKPQEFSAKTSQSAMHKPILWQQEVTRLTHVPKQQPRTGHIPDWKTNKARNMSRYIYDNIFPLFFSPYFHMLKIEVYKIRPNRLSKQVWTWVFVVAVFRALTPCLSFYTETAAHPANSFLIPTVMTPFPAFLPDRKSRGFVNGLFDTN